MRAVWRDLQVVARWSARVWGETPVVAGFIVVGSVGTAALLVAFPWMWQLVIDAVRAGDDPVVLRELGGWMLAVGVAHAALFFAVQGSRAVGNALVSAAARGDVVERLVDSRSEALREWRIGQVVSRLHDDAGDKIGWLLCSGVFRGWEALLVVVFSLGLMLSTHPTLALVVLVPLPLLMLAQAGFQGALGRRHRVLQGAIAQTSEQVTTTFGAIRVVQATHQVPAAIALFYAAARAERDAEVRARVFQSGVQALFQYGGQVSVVTLLLFGGLEVLDGRLSLGRYIAFEGLLATMIWPMFDLGNLAARVPQAAVALRRLDALLAIPTEDRGAETPDGALRADGVFGGLDLVLEPGRTVAVAGAVGSGKSTLIDALSGLRPPLDGRITLGGRDLSQVAPGWRVAVVPQEAALLSGSVRQNITLGREVSEAALREAVEIAQLDVPLDISAGEAGALLSGGQRQRVAIARALAGSPDILLLDDATSALDAQVEAAFWSALSARRPTLATLVVTHRLGTLAAADEIVVLQAGRAVERGTHTALSDQEGVYAALYVRLQAQDRLA